MAIPKKLHEKKLHVKKNDTVLVLSGKDAGKQGKVLMASPKVGKVIVEGVQVVTKHQKSRGVGMPGGIIHQEAPIASSKVMLVCDKCSKPTRIGHKILENGAKTRVCKKCGVEIDN